MRLSRETLALGAAALFALAVPALLLAPGAAPAPVRAPTPKPLAPPPQPALAAVFERPLFAPAPGAADAVPADAPQLVGIVGRIDRDAVALVRTGDGATRTLAIGESADGWQLAALAIDAAFFTRGGQRVRVPLPAGDTDAPDAPDAPDGEAPQ